MNKKGPRKGSSFKEPKPYSFGQKLYDIRTRKGLTQRELAERLNTSVRIISYYEREAKNPTIEFIEKAANALDVPKKVFFEDIATLNKIPQTPEVIKSLRMLLPKLKNLSRKKQESLVVVINSLLAEDKEGGSNP
jgi:transcriptional regulator with XRE-family HTH domain